MRAWLYGTASGGLEKNLKFHEDAPRPPSTLSKDQVLLSVVTMSVNPIDVSIPEMGMLSKVVISTPASPGMDFCGKVVSTGSTVDSLRVGELVFGKFDLPTKFGALAEFIVVPEHCVVPLPKGVEPEQAATIGVCGQTAYQSVTQNAKSGDKIFINGGSGGTGTYGIQFAKALGCHVTTSCSTANAQFCKELGADEVIDYKTQDLVQTLKDGGEQYDLVIDNVGQPENLYSESHGFVKPSGKFLQVGARVDASGMKTMMSRMLVPGFLGGGKRKFAFVSVKNDQDGMKKIASWVAEGRVRPVIQDVFGFQDAVKAYEMLKTGRTRGKIVVRVGEQ